MDREMKIERDEWIERGYENLLIPQVQLQYLTFIYITSHHITSHPISEEQ